MVSAGLLLLGLVIAQPPPGGPELPVSYELNGREQIGRSELHQHLAQALRDYTELRPREVPSASASACRGEQACLTRSLAVAAPNAERAMLVSLQSFETTDLLVLMLVDLRSGSILRRRGQPTDGNVKATLDSELRMLLGEEWGRARVRVEGPDGAVAQHPSGASCVVPCTLSDLAPGPTEITVTGREASTTTSIRLRPGAEATMHPQLVERRSGPNPWLWVGLAVLAAGAATAVGVAVAEGGSELCVSPDLSRCP